MKTQVTTWFLEMRDPSGHVAAGRIAGLQATRARIPEPDLNHFFYTRVGRRWLWYNRLPWSRDDWMKWVADPAVETWVAALQGTPAGYAELHRQNDGDVELVYFGILPSFTGRGIGRDFLSRVVDVAWRPDARRVWVHTCSLDHPAALRNYRSRGFCLYREQTAPEVIPDPGDPLWNTPRFHDTGEPFCSPSAFALLPDSRRNPGIHPLQL